MKNADVIRKILGYHPDLPGYEGCDGYKAGSSQDECRGIVTALVPTVDVIRTAIRKKCNLIITHEPIFYQTPDYPEWKGNFRNGTCEEKERLLKDNHMTVWRDHDHIHAHQPDGIFTGTIRVLEWEQFLKEDQEKFCYQFELPELTVEELGKYLKSKLHLNGLRYIGKPEDRITSAAIVGHIFPDSFYRDHLDEAGYYHDYGMDIMNLMEQGVQAIIPGEIIEWTTLAYIRDSISLGKTKACYNVGHFNIEEAGMKYAAEWIGNLVQHRIPVEYVPTGDAFNYL